MSILMVDDEFEARTLLSKILTAEGIQVRAADGGELALASLAVNRPELILIDLRMPGMDGLEVCRRLKQRADSRDIPVIFLSASGDLADLLEAFGSAQSISSPNRSSARNCSPAFGPTWSWQGCGRNSRSASPSVPPSSGRAR